MGKRREYKEPEFKRELFFPHEIMEMPTRDVPTLLAALIEHLDLTVHRTEEDNRVGFEISKE